MAKTVAAQMQEDQLGELLGVAYDARCLADRLHHQSGDPALARAVRRLDEAAAELEQVTLSGRPRLRLV